MPLPSFNTVSLFQNNTPAIFNAVSLFNDPQTNNNGNSGGNNAPCFSKNTYELLKKLNIINKAHVLIQSKKNNKKMYRCNWNQIGILEFTDDHPFLYKNQILRFDELLNNPNITDIQEIQNEEVTTVYNVIGSTEQVSKENLFYINKDLMMFGGKFNFEITQEQFEKRYDVITNLLNNENYGEIAKNKYFVKI